MPRLSESLYWTRLKLMTACEWRLREQSSMFGFLWTLLQPVLMFVVLHELFTKWMGARTPNYAAYLIIGVVMYGYFNSATTYALTSLSRRSATLLSFNAPRELVVLAAVFSSALSHAIELVLMALFIWAGGVTPTWAWLALPVLFLLETALAAGVSLGLSVVAARHHDFPRAWSIATMAGFFLTPVFYTLDTVTPERRRWLELNPLTHLLEAARDCLIRGQVPKAADLAPLALAAVLLVAAGWALFQLRAPHLADDVAV